MVDDALRAIRFAHVCILMIDAREKLNRQDLAIARLVAEEGRAMVIAANMWDAVKTVRIRLKSCNTGLISRLVRCEVCRSSPCRR